jgi:hypothetical protein
MWCYEVAKVVGAKQALVAPLCVCIRDSCETPIEVELITGW